MLQNGQTSDQALIDFIIEDQYRQVHRLCLLLLSDPTLAKQASCTALATAVTNAHTYPGHPSAPAWLYRIAVQICRRLQATPPPTSILCWFFQRGLGLIANEISYVLAIPEPEARAYLENFVSSTSPASASHGESLTLATDSIPAIPILSQEEHDQIKAKVHRLVVGSHQRKRLSLRIQEIALVCAGIFLAILLGRAASAFLPALPDQSNTTLGTRPPQALQNNSEVGSHSPDTNDPVLFAPTPVTPVPPLEPLTPTSEPGAIRQRILSSRQNWHTLWADALDIYYGPPGYIGPPKVTRQQVWISQPNLSLSLSGEADGDVYQVFLGNAGWVNALNYVTGERLRYGHNTLLGYNIPLHDLLLPTRLFATFEGLFEIAGWETLSGRKTLVMDWFTIDPSDARKDSPNNGQPRYQGRFWVDTTTGVILRRQWFDRERPGLLTREVIVTQIAFDVNIPNRLFDPSWSLPNHLAKNVNGEPIVQENNRTLQNWNTGPGRQPLNHNPAPPDFDPAQSRLVFQWTQLADFDSVDTTQADVFASGFYLGSVAFGNPSRVACNRSPDGRLIAFTEWQEGPPFGATSLRWFSLADLSTVQEPMPELISGDFAFAPDSRRLALFACLRGLAGCGLYLLDVTTGEYQRLLEMAFAGSLTWSPDGESLAFLGALKPREEASLWVVAARDSRVTYNAPLQSETGLPPADSPTITWGVQLPTGGRGLENCMAAPKE
jgi:hypothetical protein